MALNHFPFEYNKALFSVGTEMNDLSMYKSHKSAYSRQIGNYDMNKFLKHCQKWMKQIVI